MEKHNIEELISQCPLLVRTNDGREYLIVKPEFVSVGDYTTAILFARDGKLLHTVVSNLNITSIEPHAEIAKK